jgi:uncharacterized protein (DUF433 family)
MSLTLLNKHIEMSPDTMGGKPRIVGRRVAVQDVVIWHERLGKSVDEIATEYNLTLADVYAALTYYYDNQAQVDQHIREGKEWVEQLKHKVPSKLR